MKVKGVEWNSFYSDKDFWKEGMWYDVLDVIVDGVEVDDHYPVDPKSTIQFYDGVLYFDEDQKKSMPFETFFKKWRRESKVKAICVDVPNDLFEVVCEQLKKQGCKITQ